MLKKRIIPSVLYRGEEVVKGARFNSWRSIGHVRQAVELYGARQVDELLILDISATIEGREPNFSLVSDLTSSLFSPCTVGGGIRTLDHFQKALSSGADKVCICTSSMEVLGIISESAKRFGSQCVTVSVDYRSVATDGGTAFTYVRSGSVATKIHPVDWAKAVEDLGAGEIILNSIDRDGMMQGYDLDMIQEVSSSVSIPVVACGGAGSLNDFALAFDAGAHAVSAGALFAFTDVTPADAAEYLHDHGYPVRRT